MRYWRTSGRRAGAAAAVAAAALVVAACGGDDGGGGSASTATGTATGDAPAPATVTVGTLPTANAAPMYLGMKKGFFRAEGLTIEVVAMSDAAGATPQTDWQVLMVSKSSPIKEVADLKGKTIAVNALRGVSEVMIKNSLEKQGVDPDSIKLIEVPFPDMPAALGQKQVDAALATHEQEVRDIIPTYTQIPAAAAAKIRLPTFTSTVDPDSIQLNAEMAKKYGVIEEVPPMDDMVR